MQSAKLEELLRLRPASEYHEDMGDVLWWLVPICEPPYCGSPKDCGRTVELHTQMQHQPHEVGAPRRYVTRVFVGGWPGYHTHFSPLPEVLEPKVRRT